MAARESELDDFVRGSITQVARQLDPYPDQGSSGLGESLGLSRAGADVWVLDAAPNGRDPTFEYQALGEFSADGSLVYWHSPVLFRSQRGAYVMERSVTRAVYQALAAARWVYEQARFHGSIDVAVAILGIESAGGGTLAREFYAPAYGAPDYRRHARVTSEELRLGLDRIVRRLLDPLYEVISVRDYDPFGDRGR